MQMGNPKFAEWLLLVCYFASSCGVEVGNPKKPATDEPAKIEVTEDLEATSQIVTAQLEEVIESLVDNFENSDDIGLWLADPVDQSNIKTSKCVKKPDGSAETTVTKDLSGTKVTRKKDRSVQFAIKTQISDVFSSPDKSLRCNLLQRSVAVDFKSIDTLKITGSFDISRYRTIQSLPGNEILRQHAITAKGLRSVILAKNKTSIDESLFRFTQEITKDLKHTVMTTNSKNKNFSLESQIKTKDPEPLKVNIDFNKITKAWQRKEITSGTVVSIQKDASILELKYQSVVFEKTQGCLPLSGKITGKASKEDKVPLEFSITFDQDDPIVVFGNGEKHTIDIEGCDLSQ